jgi:hypothetical protein
VSEEYFFDYDKYCPKCGKLAFPNGIIPGYNVYRGGSKCPYCELWSSVWFIKKIGGKR